MNSPSFGAHCRTRTRTTVTSNVNVFFANTCIKLFSAVFNMRIQHSTVTRFLCVSVMSAFKLYPVSHFSFFLMVVHDFLQPTEAIVNLAINAITMNNTKHYI